ncbi:Phage-related protein [Cupriavidus sp. H18C1]|uniref:hypothetical protein n=1 Tax=Cupriavidus sp. H18C1 TaxID=3241601 RepID=UPI003BB86E79
MTKERPILFCGAMVRAILDGRKTQTRRVVKPQPPPAAKAVGTYHYPSDRDVFYACDAGSLIGGWAQACPYGQPGDRLWVRETWQHENYPLGPYEPGCTAFYRADYLDDPLGPDLERSTDGIRRRWNPSIHMPRAACRLVLEVTDVRVEQLNDCSEADAIAEGIKPRLSADGEWAHYADTGLSTDAIGSYRSLWEQINGPRAWEANPWVWVVEFRRAA